MRLFHFIFLIIILYIFKNDCADLTLALFKDGNCSTLLTNFNFSLTNQYSCYVPQNYNLKIKHSDIESLSLSNNNGDYYYSFYYSDFCISSIYNSSFNSYFQSCMFIENLNYNGIDTLGFYFNVR